MTQQKYTGKIMIAFALLLILMFFHLNGAEFNWNFNFQSSDSFILFKEIRLPRTLTAILAGSSISIAGLLMQTLFKNPLAGPSILGITSGSSLFVALYTMAGIQLFSSNWDIISSGILGALLFSIIILFFSKYVRQQTSLLIIGMMLGSFTNSIIQIIENQTIAEKLQTYNVWGFGSLQHVYIEQIPLILITFTLAFLMIISHIKPLNTIVLGETSAQHLGIQVKKTRFVIIISTAIFTGVTTAFCGPISFVGLAVPNLVKIWFRTTNQTILLISSAFIGSVFLLFCDCIILFLEDVIQIPLNSITSLIGAPFVVWLLLKKRIHDNM
jgi:iron complex transport system permease protein